MSWPQRQWKGNTKAVSWHKGSVLARKAVQTQGLGSVSADESTLSSLPTCHLLGMPRQRQYHPDGAPNDDTDDIDEDDAAACDASRVLVVAAATDRRDGPAEAGRRRCRRCCAALPDRRSSSATRTAQPWWCQVMLLESVTPPSPEDAH